MAHRGLAIITGGAGGLGLAFAHRWLKSGGRHARLLDFASKSQGDAAASALAAAHGSGAASFVSCDVTDRASLREGFRDTEDLGLVVNNAGIAGDTQGELFDSWDAMIGVNLTAVVDGTRLAMDAFAAQRGPDGYADGGDRVVLNVASMAGLIATPGMPVYSATKYGVVGFSRAMHIAARRRGVRVHALCPSFIDTNMVNEDTMAADPNAKKLVDMFGGLLEADAVVDSAFDKLVDDSSAKAVLRVTPLEGVAVDEPSTHPAEKAIRNAMIRADPIGMLKRMLGGGRRKKR